MACLRSYNASNDSKSNSSTFTVLKNWYTKLIVLPLQEKIYIFLKASCQPILVDLLFVLAINTFRFQLTSEIGARFSWAGLVILSQGCLPLYLIGFSSSVAVVISLPVNPVQSLHLCLPQSYP